MKGQDHANLVTALQRHDSARLDTNAKTAQMVQLITEIGPDVPEISRRLEQFKESVRYRYKEKILKKGLAIQAIVDHEKLGLKQVEMVVEFGDEFREFAQPIMIALSEIFYVTTFEKLFPKGAYLIAAAVPSEFVEAYVDAVNDLRRKGLFAAVKVRKYDWFRRVPMRTEFYDFDTGRWDYDWSSRAETDLQAAAYVPSTREKFDFTDLLILKELHIDATRSLTEISKKLKVNYKKLAWHYTEHIVGERRLIKG